MRRIANSRDDGHICRDVPSQPSREADCNRLAGKKDRDKGYDGRTAARAMTTAAHGASSQLAWFQLDRT